MAVKLRVAAIQMTAILGDVAANLEKADRLVEEAAAGGAQVIILPEFFTSAAAFHPDMLHAVLPLSGKASELLVSKARKHQAYVGGSFISSRSGNRYNTFVLAMPDGATALHDKDQPTMWENCYYKGGQDDGIIPTPVGVFGTALCWEFIRNRTARRLMGRVDLVAGGSCWWTVPKGWPLKPIWEWHHARNQNVMASTPSTFARLLGVPVIHAAHAGDFKAFMPLLPGAPYESFYMGETQIVDGSGVVLSRLSRQEGEGVIVSEITTGRTSPSLGPLGTFWIPRLPLLFRIIWAYQNIHGSWYYKKALKKGSMPLQ
jgi:predicted amidohydrolase